MAPSFTMTDTTTGVVWDVWNDNYSLTTTSSQVSTTFIWTQWANSTGTYAGDYIPPAALTEEQKAERERQRVAAAEQSRIREEQRKLKSANARKLLLEALHDSQRQELERDGYFHVETRDGTRRYRLAPSRPPIRVHGEDGRRWSYCIHPEYGYPAEDVVLAQKLLLESDEAAFLSIANASAMA